MNPLVSLILFGIGILLVGIIFFPEKGLYYRWKRALLSTERVLIEDALKHLYDCEYRQVNCTLQSIAGNLDISSDKAAELVERLESLRLITSENGNLHLTKSGRSYALRVIRVHRIWEKYLADETSVPETDWHAQAEVMEHELTPAQADELAARIGNPVVDPHGDPIPSEDGDLPGREGIVLTNLSENDFAVITHIEDEPKTVYAQIVALGLHPGMQIRVLENSPTRMVFEADGDEKILAPVIASNITVKRISKPEEISKDFKTLSSLKPGEKAEVIKISNGLRGQQRRRLMDLGVVPGAEISAELENPFGDLTAYRVKDTVIALRKNQTDHIYIRNIVRVENE